MAIYLSIKWRDGTMKTLYQFFLDCLIPIVILRCFFAFYRLRETLALSDSDDNLPEKNESPRLKKKSPPKPLKSNASRMPSAQCQRVLENAGKLRELPPLVSPLHLEAAPSRPKPPLPAKINKYVNYP